MLELAKNYEQGAINKLITDGNYKFLNYTNYKKFEPVELEQDEWNKISRVSVDSFGNILGYLEANTNYISELITSLYLVKFSYKQYFDDIIFQEDLNKFIDNLMNDSRFRFVTFTAIADNPANKTYEKWLNKYGGYRTTIFERYKLQDNKYHDVHTYVLCKNYLNKGGI